MSSFYEGDQDPDVDDDDVESSPSPSQIPQAPTSLFGPSGNQKKGDAKSKAKYSASGARIMTLDSMASDDEEEDDGTGQVCKRFTTIMYVSC